MYFEVVMKQIYLSRSLSLYLTLSVFLWLYILFSRFTLSDSLCLCVSLSLSSLYLSFFCAVNNYILHDLYAIVY